MVPCRSLRRRPAPCEDGRACCAPPVVGNPRVRIAAASLVARASAVNEPDGSPMGSTDRRLSARNPLPAMDFRHFAGAPRNDPLVLRLKCHLGVGSRANPPDRLGRRGFYQLLGNMVADHKRIGVRETPIILTRPVMASTT